MGRLQVLDMGHGHGGGTIARSSAGREGPAAIEGRHPWETGVDLGSRGRDGGDRARRLHPGLSAGVIRGRSGRAKSAAAAAAHLREFCAGRMGIFFLRLAERHTSHGQERDLLPRQACSQPSRARRAISRRRADGSGAARRVRLPDASGGETGGAREVSEVRNVPGAGRPSARPGRTRTCAARACPSSASRGGTAGCTCTGGRRRQG